MNTAQVNMKTRMTRGPKSIIPKGTYNDIRIYVKDFDKANHFFHIDCFQHKKIEEKPVKIIEPEKFINDHVEVVCITDKTTKKLTGVDLLRSQKAIETQGQKLIDEALAQLEVA